MPISLPRFQQLAQLVDEQGRPTQAFHMWWDTFAVNLETAFNDLESLVVDLAAVQAAATAAQADATQALNDAADALAEATDALNDAAAAQSTANTANTTANTVLKNDSIADSWTSPGTILSAADVGATATITIAAHTRKYNDATSVAVNGGTVTGLAFSTVYYIYYDDATRAGGAVTYNATTNPNTALPGAATGRHYCGDVTTPADGGGGTSGGYNPPSGGGRVLDSQIP